MLYRSGFTESLALCQKTFSYQHLHQATVVPTPGIMARCTGVGRGRWCWRRELERRGDGKLIGLLVENVVEDELLEVNSVGLRPGVLEGDYIRILLLWCLLVEVLTDVPWWRD